MKRGILFLLFVSFACYGEVGSITNQINAVPQIQRDKSVLAGTKGTGIEMNDAIKTTSGKANITFKDDTKVRVNENSRLLIDDFVFDPKASDAGKLALKVGAGTGRDASGQSAKNNPQKVAITTPTATIAVRGTDFNMTVDESGASLVILVPSCKDERDVKKYELEENKCKVGKIDVSTLMGTVTLDKAFEATYVVSASIPPSPPVVVNTIEGKISSLLIISQPPEVQRAGKGDGKSKREQEEEDAANEQARQLLQRMRDAETAPKSAVLPYTFDSGKAGCNPSVNVCVKWEHPEEDLAQSRGKGIAFRFNTDNYAEVKTQGYQSNTTVTIIQDDVPATAIIGSGDYGGNRVTIKQGTGVLKQ